MLPRKTNFLQCLAIGSTNRIRIVGGILTGSRDYSRKVIPRRHGKEVVFIDGARTPFMIAGTHFHVPVMNQVMLAVYPMKELRRRTGVPVDCIQYAVLGNVFTNLNASNPAREASLFAEYAPSVASYCVSMGGISSLQSIIACWGHLQNNAADVCVATGVEYMSDLPIRHSREMRMAIIKAAKFKSLSQKLATYMKVGVGALRPTTTKLSEFQTNERHGLSTERLVKMMNISRQEQDEYALRSHVLAQKAFNNGYMTDIVPVQLPDNPKVHTKDNGIRETSMEQLAKLKPAFRKDSEGTVTAGNSSFLTDGSSACFLSTETAAKKLDQKPKAYIRDFLLCCQDPVELPLTAGAFAVPRLLERNGLTVKDIDVWEILEDFAGQVLANFKIMDSEFYAKKYMNRTTKFGAPPLDKVNLWGGSLSLGHPVAATGVRLVTQAANRLIQENGHLACVMCGTYGGQGLAMLLERHPEGRL